MYKYKDILSRDKFIGPVRVSNSLISNWSKGFWLINKIVFM
jgi:hypothetical protein